MANKYRDLNVVAPPKNRKYIPVLQYTAQKDEAGNFSYTVENKSVIPKKIQDGQYGSITLSDGTKLLYFTNEIAGPITYVLLSNGEIYSDTWLFNHIDYVEKNLIDSSNNPLDIIKKLTSDEDIAKVKELVKKLDFDHFLNISYDSSSNSVTLDMDNVTPYQGEDKVQPQKDNDGNWYLPKTDNAYGELGIGYAQPYTYDSATEHNTILTPDFETVTDDAGLKFVRAKKPVEVYPDAVSGDIYPILPAKRGYTGNHLSYNMVPYDFPATIKTLNINKCYASTIYESGTKLDVYGCDGRTPSKLVTLITNESGFHNKSSIVENGEATINKGEKILAYYSVEKYTPDSLNTVTKCNPIFTSQIEQNKTTLTLELRKSGTAETTTSTIEAYKVVYTLNEDVIVSFNNIDALETYKKDKLNIYNKESIFEASSFEEKYDLLNADKAIGWHNVMSYDGSVWTPKDFMSSITKTYALASGAVTEKTDGTGTFYKFDDTMYPFSNSDIADIVCGKNFTVFLLTDGSVWTCGANYHGQLGKGTDADKDILQITPMPIDIGSFTAIAAKEQTWIAIGNNGVLYACGANTFGQFGLGDKKDRSVLTPIADNVERVQLTAGNIIIRKADGTVYGAGYNYDDRLNLNACKCVTKFTKITEVE